MYIRVSITVYDAMQCWTFRRICVWSPWQVYTHFAYIAGRNNSDTILSVIFIAKESYTSIFRDRPFNLKGVMVFFFSLRNFFSDNTRVRILFFSQNLTLGYMTKTLNQIIFFHPPKSEYCFQQHWESEYFFRKKHNLPSS